MAQAADWDRFEVHRISLGTFLKRNAIHTALLREVLRRSKRGVLEVGVGSGAQSALLSRFVQPVVTLDNDARIMRVARANLERFGRGARPVHGDAFCLPFPSRTFGVAISQGLMEHFDDAAIAALLDEQLRVADSVVFSIPSDHYPRQDVGNERLMSPAAWEKILSERLDGRLFRVAVRYYPFDLEALKYSVLAGRWLGGFSVLVSIDRVGPGEARA